MPKPPPITPYVDAADQYAWFLKAVDLLGGQRPAARAMGMGERTIQRLCAGRNPLHTGALRAIGVALLAHADACRDAERHLTPAFAANLTPDQRLRPPHPNAFKPEG